MKFDLQWLLRAIEEAAKTGHKGDEYWRATYTKEDKAVVDLLMEYIQAAGMKTYFDGLGNLYGRIDGSEEDVIMIGSHRDTVRQGGNYDGILGILTGIAAVGNLYENHGKPKKTLEVVAMCEEESSRFIAADYIGSRYIAGEFEDKELEITDEDGISLGEAIKRAGYEGTLSKGFRPEVKQFVELHIEQGGVLEHEEKQIGIVRSIVGQWGGKVSFSGHQNHAGTTPMTLRNDPVPVMSQFVQGLFDWVKPYEDDTVLTIGKIDVSPGSINVIPEKVSITFDIRSRLKQRGDSALEALQKLKEKLEGEIKIQVDISWTDQPIELNPEGIGTLEGIAKEMGSKYMVMDSGAGHDSQNMAKVYNTNMIFVPSVGGISHNQKEYTKPEDLGRGLDFLKEYIRRLGW